MRKQVKWFQWGNERIGYVSTWTISSDRSVFIGKQIRKEEAIARGYEFECPFC